MKNKLDTPWLPTLLVAVIMLGVLLAQLEAHGYDPSYFIQVGSTHVADWGAVPANIHVIPDSDGYDGQAYYQIAMNPWPEVINAGLYIGIPPIRQQRIVYPMIARLLALGNPDFIPATLVLVNYLGLLVLAWLGGRFAQQHSLHAVWGSLFALYPGFLFTLTRDLTEIVAAMFLLAGILAMSSQSQRWAILFFTLAALTRETSLLAVLAIGASMVIQKDYSRWRVVVLPTAAWGLWQAVVGARWGVLPVMAGGSNLGFPGFGLVSFLGSLSVGNAVHGIWLAEILLLANVAVAGVFAIKQMPGLLSFKLAWIGYGLLLVALSHLLWVGDLGYMRATTEFYLFGLMLIFADGRLSLINPVAALALTNWALVFFARLQW